VKGYPGSSEIEILAAFTTIGYAGLWRLRIFIVVFKKEIWRIVHGIVFIS